MDGLSGKRTKQKKRLIRMATWNVQKIDFIGSDLERLNLNSVALTETKKRGFGTETVGEYIHIFTVLPKDKRAGREVSVMMS